ncbi:MAG: hypothetical protein ABEJ57_04690 [Halobacteriaceae archaeon]
MVTGTQSPDANAEQYRPGTCNIGPEEQRRRRRLAGATTVVAVGWTVTVVLGQLPPPLLLAVFAPVMLAVEWYIEGRTAFCVRLAATGAYTFSGTTGDVEDQADHDVDVSRAIRITASAAALATAVTALLFLLVAWI